MSALTDAIEKFFEENNGKIFEVEMKKITVEVKPEPVRRMPHPYDIDGRYSLTGVMQRRFEEEEAKRRK
ncbi:MAG: hypothetical protein JSR19_10430 [Proteobacteria bacterium]|nr:hypothetical protein [Pseudomonadota bacterium]HQR03285.1 hypothetical protein [Rhodocyclaceae bacterium]